MKIMKINTAHRAAIARAWRDARAHGEDQASFCARQVPPIGPRTLRQWVKLFGSAPSDAEAGSDLRLVQAALANLHLLADLMERARLNGTPRDHPGSASRASTNIQTSEITTPEPPGGTPLAPTTEPEPAPFRGSSFWDGP